MRDLGKVIAHIPARAGSKRVRSKNLRYIAGKPLISYSIEAALNCDCLGEVYVNTDSDTISKLAIELGAKIYRRKQSLAGDTTTSDQFNMDIINSLKPDTLLMINPVCPLIDSSDISNCIEAYKQSEADTLITSNTTQMQCFYKSNPINIDTNSQLAPSQNNEPVHICNWAITIWDATKFSERYKKYGHAVFGNKRILFPIDPIKSIKISTESDFTFAGMLLKADKTKDTSKEEIKYWT